MSFLSERTTIIGVGLIGGSLGMALRSRGLAGEVAGCGRNSVRLERAMELGAIDRWDTDAVRAVEEADLVILATPLEATIEIGRTIAPALSPGACVTDVGSAKVRVIEALVSELGGTAQVVGGHPMAGSEKSGVEEARGDLFDGTLYFVVPPEDADAGAVDRVCALARGVGAVPCVIGAQEHDRIVATVSHLPHLLAALVVNLAERAIGETNSQWGYSAAAGGFRDVTRIASGDPKMWTEILLHNRCEVLRNLTVFTDLVEEARSTLERADGEAIESLLSRARSARTKFVRNAGRPPDSPAKEG